MSRLLGTTTELRGFDGEWVAMSGGPLPVEVLARIDRAEDGRFILTGLAIGMRSRREITWETLRQIRPATLLGYLFAGFDPKNPALLAHTSNPLGTQTVTGDDFDLKGWVAGRDGDTAAAVSLTSPQWTKYARAMSALRIWSTASEGSRDSGPAVEAVTKARASVATDLTAFAETYLRNLAATPRKATQATADQLHISRATVIRRLAECRAAGLIPPRSAE